MVRTTTIVITILFLSSSVFGQIDMNEGFAMLENQNFGEARDLFAEVLEDDPENITANICYGRAIGLGDNPVEALKHFKILYKQHPDNFEIGLNLAEAFMWNKDFENALLLYRAFHSSHPEDFVVNQGIANANASLNQNKEALYYIKKAIDIDPGNFGALNSSKYIRLALSGDFRKESAFHLAHLQLDTILLDFPDDKNVLLNRAVLYLTTAQIKEAQEVYTQLYTDSIDIYEGLAGLSYTSTLSSKKKQALRYALQAREHALLSESSQLKLRASLGLVNAYGLNRKFKEAFDLIETLNRSFPNEPSIKLAKARMHLWNREYKAAKKEYNSVQDTNKGYDYHIGLAEYNRATSKHADAEEQIRNGLAITPNQPDAVKLLYDVQMERQPSISIAHHISSDNGMNGVEDSQIAIHLGSKKNITPFMLYKRRKAYQLAQNTQAIQNIAAAGVSYKPHYRFSWNVSGNIISNAVSEQKTKINYTYQIMQSMLVGKYHQVQLGYSKQFHDYTVDLVKNNLGIHDYKAQYQYTHPTLPNIYAQYIYSGQTDDNVRHLVYGSLYHSILSIPSVKIGANYLQMQFKREDALYFSPDMFRNIELFAQLDTRPIKGPKFYLNVFGAIGRQQVSDQSPQMTIKAEVKVGWYVAPLLVAEVKYAYSSSANTTAAGYTHQIAGLSVQYAIPPDK